MKGTKSRHERWPADRFYWAVLDTTLLPGRWRRREAALAAVFEDLLPVPIERVQATYRHLGRGRCIACAADLNSVRRVRAGGAFSLAPSAVPGFVTADLDPGGLNLLTGSEEPMTAQRLRRWWTVLVVATVLLGASAVTIGAERRVRALDAATHRLEILRRDVLHDVLGPDVLPAGQPPALLLAAERRRLQQTRTATAPELELIDVSPFLATLLSRWPDAISHPVGADPSWIRIESIVITPTVVTVRGRVRDSAAAQRLHAAIRATPGWTSGPLQVTTTANGVAIMVQVHPRHGRTEP
jgi:hypothetical protein